MRGSRIPDSSASLALVIDIDFLTGNESVTPMREVFGYKPGWGVLSDGHRAEITALMRPAPKGGSAPASATARR